MKDKENILEKKIRESIEQERTEFQDDEPSSFNFTTVIIIILAGIILYGLMSSF